MFDDEKTENKNFPLNSLDPRNFVELLEKIDVDSQEMIKGCWHPMRRRIDKPDPNSDQVAINIQESIDNPVHKEHLIDATVSLKKTFTEAHVGKRD